MGTVSIVLILFGLPALLYAALWVASWRRREPPARLGGWMVAAIALHGVSLTWPWDGFRFGFAKALSATMWIGVVLLWFESRRLRVDALRILILPPAVVALLLPLVFPGSGFPQLATRPLFVPHLVAGTLAYGVLLLAALHALLMFLAERDLHRVDREGAGAFARLIGELPPLMALERILFRFIGVGFALLLLTTASGVVFSEQVFGRPLRFDHKVVFSLLALAFFGVLLAGRALRGWRGRIATGFTLWGFATLMLAYVGTRFVLEVILHRY
ncbi:MAG TPA: cytochrome c biogenesis protein CcsA [Burkholderiaceae bacterium]|nr:cytochrome c biogenesis protein CcsA [Burkholderiaceae bacterium]